MNTRTPEPARPPEPSRHPRGTFPYQNRPAPPPADGGASLSPDPASPAASGPRTASPPCRSSLRRRLRPPENAATLLRGARTVALALAALVLGVPEMVQAQIVTLVSNSGQADAGTRQPGANTFAQSFDTGSNSYGYNLSSIALDFAAAPTGTGTLTVTVREDSSGSPSETVLYTLNNPTHSAGLNEFSAQGNTTLNARTTYWVVASYSTNSGGGPTWSRTGISNGVDEGAAAGWGIDAEYKQKLRLLPAATWSVGALNQTLQIAVKGTVKTTANTAPTADHKTVMTVEDRAYTFTAADFGFMDADPGATLVSVKIVTVPSKGTLALDGVAITAYAVVTKAQIDGEMLIFTPARDAHGIPYVVFSFKVNDGMVDSTDTYTMLIDVTDTPAPDCTAPSFGDRREIWTGTVTVGTYRFGGSPLDFYGYNSSAPPSGALDDQTFTIGSNDYTIVLARVALGGSNSGELLFEMETGQTLTTVEVAALRLHVCDTTVYNFSEATNSRLNSYGWSGSLDWSYPVVTRTVYLSLPANHAATGEPAITGTATVGQELTATTGTIADDDGLPSSFTYQWVRVDAEGTSNPVDITGEIAETYTLTDDDVGKKIKVKVSFTDELSGVEMRTSAAYPSSGTVTAAAGTPTGAPTITGTAQVGETLTAVTTSIADADGLTTSTYTYQWIRVNGTEADIAGANSSTYTLVAADLGKTIKVRVTFVDDADNTEMLTSASSGTVTTEVTPPSLSSATVQGMVLTLVYDEPLDPASTPAPLVYILTVTATVGTTTTNTTTNPAAVSVSGSRVTLTLDTAPAAGARVTLVYAGAVVNPVQDVAGNDALPFGVQVMRGNPPPPTNTAPTAANNTVTTGVGTAYTFTEDDFGFADADAGATLASVKIVTVPAKGTLALDGTAVALNDVVTKAQIDGDMLTFTPVAGASGDPYTTFTFKVNDGTVDSASAYTMTIDVTAAPVTNTAPTGADKTVTTNENTAYIFTADDFGFMDADTGATLASVKIVTVPTPGTLALDGTEAIADQVVTQAQIDGNMLTFTPVAGASGDAYASFTFKVNDGTVDSASAYTMTIKVKPVDLAPQLASATVVDYTLTLTYDEPLDEGSEPAASAFTLAGTTATVTAVSVMGRRVILTLTAAPAETDVVTLTYRVPTGTGAMPVRDEAGNPAPAFSGTTVTRRNPPPPPPPPPPPTTNTPPEVANPLADQEATTGASFTYVIPAAAFTDADGTMLAYTAALSDGGRLPSWLTFDAATQTFTGTPGPGDGGTVRVTVMASDGTATVSDEFVLMVTVRNTPPVVANPLADQEVMIDVPFTYVVPADAFTDADGDPLAYTAATRDGGLLPSWLTFDPATRTFTGTPASSDSGPVFVTVTASDGTATVSDEFALRVLMVAPSTLRAWTSRFGRTVATHVTDAVGERLRAPPEQDSQVTVGGYRLPLGRQAAGGADPDATTDSETTEPKTATDRLASLLTGLVGRALGLGPAQPQGGGTGTDPWAAPPVAAPRLGQSQTLQLPTVRLRDVLLGSSFRLTLGDDDAAPGHLRLTAWGRVAGTQFDGRDGALTLDGNVLTGTVGVDSAWDRWLAGVAVSHSLGGGSFTGDGDGDLDSSTLTSIHPYLRYAVNERVDVWSVLGYGWGDMTLEPGTGGTLETDTTLLMGSFGGRGILLSAPDNAGFQLATRTDAMLTRTTSGAVAGLAETEADAHRLRLVLEGTRPVLWPEGQSVTPSVELGVRHDWGDAETGFGLELGGRVQYADPTLGLTIEAAVRGLLTHEDSDYKEWGASGTIRLAPDLNGQGLSLTLAPTWGAASSGIESLWSRQTTAGLAPQGTRPRPTTSLNAEMGYGVAAPFGTGLLTPYAGTVLTDGQARTYRLGTRWTSVSGLTLNVEGLRQESPGQQPVNQGLHLQIGWGF